MNRRLVFRSAPGGFSLIELLVVVGVITLLLTLLVAGTGGTRAISLTNGGTMLANLAVNAQQAATSRNAMIMLVVAANDEGDYTLLGTLEHPLGATEWVQTRRWESLPEGIILDVDASELPSPPLKNNPFPLTHSGRDIQEDNSVFQIFLPGGQLLGGQNAVYELVSKSDVQRNNYCRIYINAATGLFRTERP